MIFAKNELTKCFVNFGSIAQVETCFGSNKTIIFAVVLQMKR